MRTSRKRGRREYNCRRKSRREEECTNRQTIDLCSRIQVASSRVRGTEKSTVPESPERMGEEAGERLSASAIARRRERWWWPVQVGLRRRGTLGHEQSQTDNRAHALRVDWPLTTPRHCTGMPTEGDANEINGETDQRHAPSKPLDQERGYSCYSMTATTTLIRTLTFV